MVSSRDLNASVVVTRVCFIEYFIHGSAINSCDSPVLHQLDAPFREGSAGHWSVVTHYKLLVLGFVYHGDCLVDRVVVASHVIIGCLEVGVDEIPSWTVVEDSLLHFEAI